MVKTQEMKEFAMYLKHSESPAIHSNILGRCQEVEEEEHRRQGCYIRVLSKVIIHLEEIVGTEHETRKITLRERTNMVTPMRYWTGTSQVFLRPKEAT